MRKDEVVLETKVSAVPKSLEVQPEDSEEAIERKKRKLNMFKRQEKKLKEEQQSDTRWVPCDAPVTFPGSIERRKASLSSGAHRFRRRSNWSNFSRKNKTIRGAKNWHDPNWDPTRDHGELAARQQLEKYTT